VVFQQPQRTAAHTHGLEEAVAVLQSPVSTIERGTAPAIDPSGRHFRISILSHK
jgi:hypothetical protein